MARAALRVMVVQRVRISSVLGRGGTLGTTEALPLSGPLLKLTPSERLGSGLLCELSGCCEVAGWSAWFCASSLRLEDESLLEENSEKMESELIWLLMLGRVFEAGASLSSSP